MKSKNNLKIQSKCVNCLLRSEKFFCNLPDSDLKTFEFLKVTNSYKKGARLFLQGQHANGIYMLCQGRVKLSSCSKEGKAIILHIAEPGEVLEIGAAISDSVHIATAEAVEPSQVNFVTNKDFLSFLKNNADAGVNAVKQLSRNYQKACRQICALGLSASVADKLAALLLDWCEKSYKDGEGYHLKISYTHEELAQMIGTTRETVTRLLRNFAERKLITRKGSELIVHDREKLAATIGRLLKSESNLGISK